MNAGGLLSRWQSSDTPYRVAAELGRESFKSNALGTVLSATAPQLGGAQFLIVKAPDLFPADVFQAQKAFLDAGGKARICLAGQRASLEHLAAGADVEHVGFMLDDVGLQTSCAEMVWDGFEAVRFSETFVALALRDVRTGCAFASLLGLARELGLRTLGPAVPTPLASFGRLTFDYVPAETPANERMVPKPTPLRRPSTLRQ